MIMINEKKLQKVLRNTEDSISIYELGRKLAYNHDDLWEYIEKIIVPRTKTFYKDYAHRLPLMNPLKAKEFFQNDVVDIGMLVQHKITEIKEALREKHNTWGHQQFHDSWIMHRGY